MSRPKSLTDLSESRPYGGSLRRELCLELIDKFEGIAGVATRMRSDYDAALKSPTIRARILDTVGSLIAGLPDEPAPPVSQDDLLAEFRELVKNPEIRPLLVEMMTANAPDNS